MWEPAGPLPPSVYWRRRCVALGVVVAVLGGIVWAVVGLAGGGEPDPATVEARARAAAMASQQTSTPPTPPPGSGPGSESGPIAAALPSVIPPGGAPALTPGPDGALFVPPGGDGFRNFLPPGVPAGSSGPLLGPAVTSPTPPASETPPSATTNPTTNPTTTTTEQPTPASAPAPGPCADGDLRVTARTDAPSYAAGRKPVLSLVVTNTGTAPCVRDLDAAKQAVAVVKRPGDGLWGSNDCSPGDTDDVRTLAPGEEAVFSVHWSGKTSQPGCRGERTAVPPGTYQLLARLDGIVSDPVTFTLEG
ncbi:hypothetical protein Acsp06_48660 [Actinomycetospora sp. NBRC 106375]|uniref:DUF4232 domain-containing protein n=1 Tax=Actinomycetospora sp. NBRC 106375 TaxID=3032207 RepID=UPI0024A53670|nr:DUF4232 domain-containing protein [Actinomycetospora sp. NBRC 106375]GLZ48681.1 hypothetical protein Acsp06_48660 [Actinomycetospora sp. NBRC 106375]